MNVKSVSNPVLNLEALATNPAKERVKTFESADRDANGKQEFAEKEPDRDLDDQEIEAVHEKLQGLPAVKEHQLSVKLQMTGAMKMIVILSPTGVVIKRLTPFQALKSTQNIDQGTSKGQLLNKAM